MSYFYFSVGAALGFLIGFAIGVTRRPLGDSALAIECDAQKARACKAERRLRAVKSALELTP